MRRRMLVLVCLGFAAFAQQLPDPTHSIPDKEPEARLPNGKLQRDEILKAEHGKSLEDAAEMVKLSEELQRALEKDGSFVVSLQTIKKTEEIEKLAKRIRNRLKRG